MSTLWKLLNKIGKTHHSACLTNLIKIRHIKTSYIFSLFNDTSGEESEISKFASNFDDVSLDSLLGDSQVILDRLIKE